jgi:hypothetical protein
VRGGAINFSSWFTGEDRSWGAYLVGLVVVLRVVLEDLGLLLVVEGARKVVGAKLLAPGLTLDEPRQPR